MAFWDWVIALTVILGFILAIWARVSRQTIGELLRDIKEMILDTREDVTENVTYPFYDG